MSSITTTRSGRIVKKPVIYEPEEVDLVDDYKNDDYETDDDGSMSETASIVSEGTSGDDDTSSLDSFIDDEDDDCD